MILNIICCQLQKILVFVGKNIGSKDVWSLVLQLPIRSWHMSLKCGMHITWLVSLSVVKWAMCIAHNKYICHIPIGGWSLVGAKLCPFCSILWKLCFLTGHPDCSHTHSTTSNCWFSSARKFNNAFAFLDVWKPELWSNDYIMSSLMLLVTTIP